MLTFDEFRASVKSWDLRSASTTEDDEFWAYYNASRLVEATSAICNPKNKAFHLYRVTVEGCENGWTIVARDDGYYDAFAGDYLGTIYSSDRFSFLRLNFYNY